MTALELERSLSGSDTDKAPLMVHLEAEPDGCNVALCGAQLRGIDAEDSDLDCVVCAEIAASLGGWW